MLLTILRTIVHYGLHFGTPFLFAQCYKGEKKMKAFWLLMATMFIDLDHFLATPIFNPYRCSVGFHPLHSYFMVTVYVLMCILPLKKLHLPWWIRPLGIGLLCHILTDLQDFYLWQQYLTY